MSNSPFENVVAQLPEEWRGTLKAVKKHGQELLDCAPRFKFFTLHGREHLDSLFSILNSLLLGGIRLPDRDLYLLSLAICTHDLGMVLPLKSYTDDEIYKGKFGVSNPSDFELHIRNIHHEVIGEYFSENLNFVTNLGLNQADLSIVESIGKAHRKIRLYDLPPHERRLGALMRVIDELDVGPDRAPAAIFDVFRGEMDAVSKWHWYKHTITSPWQDGVNVNSIKKNGKVSIVFSPAVYPARSESISYWMQKVIFLIQKALLDEKCSEIIKSEYGVEIDVLPNYASSRISSVWKKKRELEDEILTANRPVALVIDDLSQKLEDLFHFVQEDFHVHRVSKVTDGLEYLKAAKVSVVVVDMQMPDDGLWGAEVTANYKLTGAKVVEEIKRRWPKTKTCILTATKHKIPESAIKNADFILRKPIDPIDLRKKLQELI